MKSFPITEEPSQKNKYIKVKYNCDFISLIEFYQLCSDASCSLVLEQFLFVPLDNLIYPLWQDCRYESEVQLVSFEPHEQKAGSCCVGVGEDVGASSSQ